MVNGEWWGTIGFDHCVDEHMWQPLEIDALRAAAGLVGLAIHRDRVEAERHQIERALRESEQRFRGIAEASSTQARRRVRFSASPTMSDRAPPITTPTPRNVAA